ncbi:heat shock protein 90-6, mitochondrial-like [Salvia divinorum]|uniref:Heat shock protein 90-6, mitochondrial-like n=1 Tax=Salvia divinorum TaxID=28513 RepID=A0ABD1GRX9_SALDI
MHRLARRSVPDILRSSAARHRAIYSVDHQLSGESDTTKRWCSVLTTGGSNAIGATTSFDLKRGHFMGCRYETTANSANPPPPPEKNEYQSEKKKKTKSVVGRDWDRELTNERQPIWLHNPDEVKKEDYDEFYRKTFNDYLDPLASSHFATEGEVEFRSILYVPSMKPSGKDDMINHKTKNIGLFVKGVFISDDFDGELFPRYLRFIKGIVDSNDSPLNVSRKVLQESRIVHIMKKRLVHKAFDMILGISMSEDREDYMKFWRNFGKHLKLGCIEDRENRKRIAPLLRFFSSQSKEDVISLDEYVENMKADQKDIYFIETDSIYSARKTPLVKKLAKKDIEVLFLVDPTDKVAIQNLKSYKDKNFVDITKEDLNLGGKDEERYKEMKQEFGTCDLIKKVALPDSRVIYTVLRSPHIDKKSREQFQMIVKKEYYVIKAQRPSELRQKFFWLKRRATWRT